VRPRRVCRCDTMSGAVGFRFVAMRILLLAVPVLAQSGIDEDYHVYTDSPRLLLIRPRLRLLERERERQSMRWQQLENLISGGAPMPEPGFALALYYKVARDQGAAKKAVEWALGPAQDLRQLALVFDWCGPVMSPSETDRLAGKIEKALAAPASDVRGQSARALAAIAIADRLPDHGEAVLKTLVEKWWRGDVAPRLLNGDPAIPRDQIYALYEMMHAIRDNLKIDLRESAAAYFRALPADHLTGHYPATFAAAENEYRVPVYVHDGNPDVTEAILSRAAELAMVAYDANALDSQYLQGWLMQDRFLMRSGLGIVYEFMWANPYQPGLSYFQMPLIFHDPTTGHVFARTSWDENATWVGYFDGHLQLFRDGQIESLRQGAQAKPLRAAGALILPAENKDAARFHADAEAVFVLNLTPHAAYDVEVDDEEMCEMDTDAGGTLVLAFPENTDTGVRIHRH
jgi:hypothetical protein